MASFKLRHYRGLIIPFLLAACLVTGYWFYWSKAAHLIETQVRTRLPAAGASAVKVTGFPYRLTLEIDDVKVTAKSGAAFSASSVVATATPFNPMLWVLEGAHDPVFALPNGPARPLKATNLKASVRLQTQGLERFSLTFDGLEARGDGGWVLGKGLFHVMSRFEDDNSLAMVLDVKDVKFGAPLEGPGAILGDTINHIFMSGPINQRQALMQSAQSWRDAGGKFTIMAGEIIWGPVYLTKAQGDVALSANDTWSGKMSGQGALKPEGIAVAGLSAPVNLEIRDSQLFLSGLPGIDMTNALR
jgi:hypothetical protein